MDHYFQILACSEVLGTCCSDYGLVGILDILRQCLNLIQLIVPIILMVALAIQFTQLMANPDDKKKQKSLINKFVAALICFFIPLLVNLSINLVPDTFQLSACWDTARISREVLQSQNSSYISPTDKEAKKFILLGDAYEPGVPGSGGSGSAGSGSATGRAIVAYALQFVGQQYVYGGSWNGEPPYTPTDCSGFVQGVFSHFGISLPRDTNSQWAATNTYTLVSPSDIQAGDVVMYYDHVGILTGNGEEMVHASNSSPYPAGGVKTSATYNYRTVRGIMRINGVN